MNPFTDEDLERLKFANTFGFYVEYADIQALIARLEAAEIVADEMTRVENLYESEVDHIKEWRKAAGK